MSHTTGFISMNFLSVFDGAGLAGWEWNIPMTCSFLLSATSYACSTSCGSILKEMADWSAFCIAKILTTLSFLPRRNAQDSFGRELLASLACCSICVGAREISIILQ